MKTNLLSELNHRPYPIPKRPWVMSMCWLNLLFIHYPLDPKVLEPFIPQKLELDTFEGAAWLGIVPFEMRDVKPRYSPSVRGLSHFPELNVRTYVRHKDKAGVWFFSLDAANPIAVRLARAGFHLPYYHAAMQCRVEGDGVHYKSQRTHKGVAEAYFEGLYYPTSDVTSAKSASLDHFLTERYCLFSEDKRGNVYRGDIHHAPWPLQAATLEKAQMEMTGLLGLDMPSATPHLHFAKELEVLAWLPERL